jgi:hypothetical protein
MLAVMLMLQAGRSRVIFPIISLKFWIDINFPASLWPWVRLSHQQKWVPGIFLGVKGNRSIRLTTSPSFVSRMSKKILELRRLITLRASTAIHKDSFAFLQKISPLQGPSVRGRQSSFPGILFFFFFHLKCARFLRGALIPVCWPSPNAKEPFRAYCRCWVVHYWAPFSHIVVGPCSWRHERTHHLAAHTNGR